MIVTFQSLLVIYTLPAVASHALELLTYLNPVEERIAISITAHGKHTLPVPIGCPMRHSHAIEQEGSIPCKFRHGPRPTNFNELLNCIEKVGYSPTWVPQRLERVFLTCLARSRGFRTLTPTHRYATLLYSLAVVDIDLGTANTMGRLAHMEIPPTADDAKRPITTFRRM